MSLEHFKFMAKYNKRMNLQVYKAAEQLTNEQLHEDRRAFFGSVLGTLNHVIVGDLIWLERFRFHSDNYNSLADLQKYDTPRALSHILYTDYRTLEEARAGIDELILKWIDTELTESDLKRDFHYSNAHDVKSVRNFSEVLSHFFNHQTHHRGQVSTLLHQFDCDVGVTDYLIDIPDTYKE